MQEQEEDRRIQFRQDLLSLPGGQAWLIHVGGLFGWRERLLGPGGFGMPDGLRIAMHARGW